LSAAETSPGGEGWSAKDYLLAAALAAGHGVLAAAKDAKVSRSTAWRRNQDAAFRALVDEYRAQQTDEIAGQLIAAGPKAVAALVQMLASGNESVKVGAAKALLEYGARYQELYLIAQGQAELRERVNQLMEARYEQSGRAAAIPWRDGAEPGVDPPGESEDSGDAGPAGPDGCGDGGGAGRPVPRPGEHFSFGFPDP
jgi:hypothetical protein